MKIRVPYPVAGIIRRNPVNANRYAKPHRGLGEQVAKVNKRLKVRLGQDSHDNYACFYVRKHHRDRVNVVTIITLFRIRIVLHVVAVFKIVSAVTAAYSGLLHVYYSILRV